MDVLAPADPVPGGQPEVARSYGFPSTGIPDDFRPGKGSLPDAGGNLDGRGASGIVRAGPDGPRHQTGDGKIREARAGLPNLRRLPVAAPRQPQPHKSPRRALHGASKALAPEKAKAFEWDRYDDAGPPGSPGEGWSFK